MVAVFEDDQQWINDRSVTLYLQSANFVSGIPQLLIGTEISLAQKTLKTYNLVSKLSKPPNVLTK